MTEEQKIALECVEAEIKALDAEYQEWKSQRVAPTGTQAQVLQHVGENAMKERDYLNKRQMYERAKADIVGVSDGVKAYLEGQKTKSPFEYSKFDVDAGVAAVDNSLSPLGGKEL